MKIFQIFPFAGLAAALLAGTSTIASTDAMKPCGDAQAARDLALQLLDDPKPLAGYLVSPDPMARRYAIYGLQLSGNPQFAEAIHPLLKDPDAEVQLAAVEAVGKLGNFGSVKVLMPFLESDDVVLRYQAIMALGRIGDPATAPELTNAMQDPRLWLDLPTWDSVCLYNVIAADFYKDPKVKDLLYRMLEYRSWEHPLLADLEPSRRDALIWTVAHRAAILLANKYNDPAGKDLVLEGFSRSPYDQQLSAYTAGRLKLAGALSGLEGMLGSEWHNNRMDAIRAMGEMGDSGAVGILEPLLENEDLATREAAAVALEKIDGKKRTLTMVSAAAKVPKEDYPPYPGGQRPPQFITLGVDDCASIEGLESMVDICRTLDELGSKAVFTMWVAPLAGNFQVRDIEKQKFLLQILFDYGCEFANHTLHHNPGGRNWHSLGSDIQIQEVEGHTAWMRENIDGYTRSFTIKYGGGGKGAMADESFTNDLIRRQEYLYTLQRGQHPHEQKWPYEEQTYRAKYVLETGSLDGSAPPVHADITNPIVSDYPGRFDFDMDAGLKMWTSNFDYRYSLPHRPVFAVNAFHDWGLKSPSSMTLTYNSHRNEGALLKAFLVDVLVDNKEKYPDAHCVTFRQVLEYSLNNGDVEKTLALGNGQDSR